ncbi:hypothetical protein DKX38_005355 [Salix brachista]|uniref:Uncharacterized protein n=1 Tax=Salix brachista TaxID=2182728 RepID=A0A5N5N0A0_9ROSI|nr:hypothetical protein DKX38_005355 [Salix brachista]
MEIMRSPRILNSNVENMAQIVDVLQDIGVPEKNIALLIRCKPSIMISNLENLKKLIEEVTLIGFHPFKRDGGLSEEEILTAFVKLPMFMRKSAEKITASMDLFVNKLVPKGLVEKSFRSLAFFNTPEDKFRQIYIDHHAESTQILKFHEEKLNLSSVVNSSTF